jgi:hypothetical protein
MTPTAAEQMDAIMAGAYRAAEALLSANMDMIIAAVERAVVTALTSKKGLRAINHGVQAGLMINMNEKDDVLGAIHDGVQDAILASIGENTSVNAAIRQGTEQAVAEAIDQGRLTI